MAITWDTARKKATVTLSNGNLTASLSGTDSGDVVSSTGVTSVQKYYCEITVTTKTAPIIFVAGNDFDPLTESWSTSQKIRGYYSYSASAKYPENVTYGQVMANADVISILLDLVNNTLEFWRNGVSLGVSHTNLSALTRPINIGIGIGTAVGASVLVANFGDSGTQFKYSIPNGYVSFSKNFIDKILLSLNGKGLAIKKADYLSNVSAVPQMTANNAPYGVVTASSNSGTNYPWQALDSSLTTKWNANVTQPTGGHWIQYEFPTAKRIGKITLKSEVVSTTFYGLKDFKFYGSNDGVNYDLLYSGQNPNNGNTSAFEFDNEKLYKMYRLNVTSGWHTVDNVYLDHMEMFELSDEKLIFLDQVTEENFLSDGMDNYAEIYVDASFIIDKVGNSTVTGSGKTFTHSIDLLKYKGKKISF